MNPPGPHPRLGGVMACPPQLPSQREQLHTGAWGSLQLPDWQELSTGLWSKLRPPALQFVAAWLATRPRSGKLHKLMVTRGPLGTPTRTLPRQFLLKATNRQASCHGKCVRPAPSPRKCLAERPHTSAKESDKAYQSHPIPHTSRRMSSAPSPLREQTLLPVCGAAKGSVLDAPWCSLFPVEPSAQWADHGNPSLECTSPCSRGPP
mmetsp:Transcript_65107/g.105271  ORF Transcript_65107/g.105271 Transcript_65107/m.105271 type:complete len:206 (+) Transcript_65107:2121-2738(+)